MQQQAQALTQQTSQIEMSVNEIERTLNEIEDTNDKSTSAFISLDLFLEITIRK